MRLCFKLGDQRDTKNYFSESMARLTFGISFGSIFTSVALPWRSSRIPLATMIALLRSNGLLLGPHQMKISWQCTMVITMEVSVPLSENFFGSEHRFPLSYILPITRPSRSIHILSSTVVPSEYKKWQTISVYHTVPLSKMNESPSVRLPHFIWTSSVLTGRLPLTFRSMFRSSTTFVSAWVNPDSTPPSLYGKKRT